MVIFPYEHLKVSSLDLPTRLLQIEGQNYIDVDISVEVLSF